MVFPAIESVHVIALALMAGTIALVDLRLLGAIWRDVPAHDVERRIVPVTWFGFALMAISGGLLFAAEAVKIIDNRAFQVKLVLLLLAGLNMILFQWTSPPRGRAGRAGQALPLPARTGAALSLLLWTGVIATGRAIAYY